MKRLLVLLLLLALVVTPAAHGAGNAEEIIRAHIKALNEGNLEDLLALFSPEARVFNVPDNPERLVGKLSDEVGTQEQRKKFYPAMFAKKPLPRREILQIVAVGDLAAVKLKVNDPPDSAKADHFLSIYRIGDRQILDLWHAAKAGDSSPSGEEIGNVIRKHVAANNKGDIEDFLASFSSDSKYFRGTDDPHGLADKLSERMSGKDNMRKSITAIFAKGSPGQAEIVGLLTVGDLVVTHDHVVLPNGDIYNQLKIYRVRKGLIVHDWTAYEKKE